VELGDSGLKIMNALDNKIYMSGDWTKDFLDVTMIALPKKNQAKKYSDHRTISLISHTGKIAARILSKIKEIIEEDQFGFWKGKGTRDAIGLIRIISERVLGIKEEMCLCFIDWQKAFECIDWIKLLDMLRNIGVNWRECRLICNLYMGKKKENLRLKEGELSVWRLEQESDKNVACMRFQDWRKDY